VSVPTVRRRWRDGACLAPTAICTADPRPCSRTQCIATKQRHPIGLSRSYVADALWVLRQVLAFARANGLFPAGFDPTEGLEAPAPDPAVARTRAPRAQPRPLTLPECARVAAHLHPVHQTVFWLQRIMGLRISEAYGIVVSDVVDLGGIGMLAVKAGGRTFNVRDNHGKVALCAQADDEDLRGLAGSRRPREDDGAVPSRDRGLPHDPDSGEVDASARLCPVFT